MTNSSTNGNSEEVQREFLYAISILEQADCPPLYRAEALDKLRNVLDAIDWQSTKPENLRHNDDDPRYENPNAGKKCRVALTGIATKYAQWLNDELVLVEVIDEDEDFCVVTPDKVEWLSDESE